MLLLCLYIITNILFDNYYISFKYPLMNQLANLVKTSFIKISTQKA